MSTKTSKKKNSRPVIVDSKATNKGRTVKRVSGAPKKDEQGRMNLSTSSTPYLVGGGIDKKLNISDDGVISIKTTHADGKVEEKVFDILPPDYQEPKNKKTPKSRMNKAERVASIPVEGRFEVVKNSSVKKGGSKKEWIFNNSKTDVLINKATKTIMTGKTENGCIIINDYIHSDVLTKEDMDTPEFKSLVRKNVLQIVSANEILKLIKGKVATLLESKYDGDNILARQIEGLTAKDLNEILKRSIIKRVEHIDEKTLNRINWFITSSLRDEAKLPAGCVVDVHGNVIDERRVKKVLVNLGTSGTVEIPTSRGNINVNCENIEATEDKMLPNERGESFFNVEDNIVNLRDRIANLKNKMHGNRLETRQDVKYIDIAKKAIDSGAEIVKKQISKVISLLSK